MTNSRRVREAMKELRLTTVVTGTYDGASGEFNFAYAAHPRMFVWRAREEKFCELGEGLENLPLGFITGEQYTEQSIRLNVGDMILAFFRMGRRRRCHQAGRAVDTRGISGAGGEDVERDGGAGELVGILAADC